MEQKILNLTKKLIKIPSIKNNTKALHKIINFCGRYFVGKEFIIEKLESNRKPSLVVLFKKTHSPELFLVGHLDVVEAEKSQFVPQKKGKRLYGRGAADMKGSCATMMVLMKDLGSFPLEKPSLGLILTTDEEIGGYDGVRYLLRDKKYSCKVAFVPDAGKNFKIITSEKGILHFKMIAKGRAAHGSRPWQGENAIDKLIVVYQRLRNVFPNPKNNNDWRISLNLGKIQGGDAVNKVADFAEAYLDLRYPENYNQKKIVRKIKKLASGLKIEILTGGMPFYTSKNNSYILKYHKICRQILKRAPSFIKHPAASDARFFSEKKIPVILTAPIKGGEHGRYEWVDTESLEKLYNILKKFILEN